MITITNEIKRATKAAGGDADGDNNDGNVVVLISSFCLTIDETDAQTLAKPSNVNEARVSALASSFETEYESQLLSLRDDTLQHFAR